ncbi:hypothetical protein DM02DRAFT_322392 [Periconia macrospinosa]|uniref:Uncharacterized protein n=1 Tax=Periconia macrospinosa TaxID=97972 RepID=A0A2V1EBA4_9PLEO|nr:hypothetical protein DM02DRAFT_322392 [Periconia macrospinosa]
MSDKKRPKPDPLREELDAAADRFDALLKQVRERDEALEKNRGTDTTTHNDGINDGIKIKPRREIKLSPLFKKLEENPGQLDHDEASIARKATINELLGKLGMKPVDYGDFFNKKSNARTAAAGDFSKKWDEKTPELVDLEKKVEKIFEKMKSMQPEFGIFDKTPADFFQKSDDKSKEPNIFGKLSQNSMKDKKANGEKNSDNDEEDEEDEDEKFIADFEKIMADAEDWWNDDVAYEAKMEELFIRELRLLEQGRELQKPPKHSVFWDIYLKGDDTSMSADAAMSADPPRNFSTDEIRDGFEAVKEFIRFSVLKSDRKYLQAVHFTQREKNHMMRNTADHMEDFNDTMDNLMHIQGMIHPGTIPNTKKLDEINKAFANFAICTSRNVAAIQKEMGVRDERYDSMLEDAKNEFLADEKEHRSTIEKFKKLVKDAGVNMNPSFAGE